MRRGCLISVLVILGLCVVGCGAVYFVGLPRFQDAIADEFEHAFSTEVARQIPSSGGQPPAPGRYEFTEESLRLRLEAEAESGNVNDILINITPDGIELGFDTGGQDILYSGGVAAENGRLVLTDFETNNDALEFFLPADKMGDAIEDAVNNYLAENNLQLASVELGDGELTLVTEPASQLTGQ